MTINKINNYLTLIDSPYLGKQNVLGTYLIQGEKSVIIDPGPTVTIPFIIEALNMRNIGVSGLNLIAITHIHLDHAAGCWRLIQQYQDLKLLVHPRGSIHMVNPDNLEKGARGLFGDAISNYGEIKGVPENRIISSKDSETMDLGGITLSVIWTPGHSSHHQCFLLNEDKILILGDAGGHYFPEDGTIMPTTPPPFNPEKAIDSINRLIELNPEILCYGHFGYTSNAIEKLEAYKNQILLWNDIIGDGFDRGLSPDEIYQKLQSKDIQIKNRDIHHIERDPSVSIMGFIKYHEWKKSHK